MIETEIIGGYKIQIPAQIGTVTFKRIIGAGSFGVVYEGFCNKRKQNVACKCVSRQVLIDKGQFGFFEQEVRIHENLKHPNIVTLYDVFYQKDSIVMSMEQCVVGDLLNFTIKHHHVQPTLARRIFYQISSAVAYLHQRGISHRDIKPENIIIDENFNAKLADFGCAQSPAKFGRKEPSCGTLVYAPPEVINDSVTDSRKCDVWSLGILLYTMITGHLPFFGSEEAMKQQILRGELSFPDIFPYAAMDIIKECTNLDPAKRPSAQEIMMSAYLVNEKPKLNSTIKIKTLSPNVVFPLSSKQRQIVLKPNLSAKTMSAELSLFSQNMTNLKQSTKRHSKVKSLSCPPMEESNGPNLSISRLAP